MKINNNIVIASILVITIIVITSMKLSFDILNQHDRSLYGMWVADDEFKESASLDSFIFFINPPNNDMKNTISKRGTKCNIYILIKSGGDTKYSGVIKADIKNTTMMPNGIGTYKIDIGKKIDILPKKISIKYDPVNSMCIIHSGETMYARLFKNTIASFNCRIHDNSVLKPNEEEDEEDGEDE